MAPGDIKYVRVEEGGNYMDMESEHFPRLLPVT